jgi:transcriptional repressor NrdR
VRELLDAVVSVLEGEEVASERIGELVMERLHAIDEVAYIRFASVYRRFTDLNQFLSAITEMVEK